MRCLWMLTGLLTFVGGCDCGGAAMVDAGRDAPRADTPPLDTGIDAGAMDDAGPMDDTGIDAGAMDDAAPLDDAGVDAAMDDGGTDAGRAEDCDVRGDEDGDGNADCADVACATSAPCMAGCVLPPPPAPPLDPTSVGIPADGLVLWLRSDRGVHTEADGDVCAWTSQVGPDRFTPEGGAPSFVADWMPGIPALRAEAGDRMAAPGVQGIATNAPRTFFTVSEVVTPTAQTPTIYQGHAGSAGLYVGIEHNVSGTAGSRYGVHMPDGVGIDTMFATSMGDVAVETLVLDTLTVGASHDAVARYFNDGRPSGLTVVFGPPTVSTFAPDRTWVLWSNDGTFLATEVLVYSRALSRPEQQAVETYLAGRYGVTLP